MDEKEKKRKNKEEIEKVWKNCKKKIRKQNRKENGRKRQ